MFVQGSDIEVKNIGLGVTSVEGRVLGWFVKISFNFLYIEIFASIGR